MIFVLIASESSKDSDKTAHMHSLTSLCDSHTLSMDVDEDSNQYLDLLPRWMRQHEHFKKALAKCNR